MALPFLPGNVFDKNLGKIKFHKSHHFDMNACENIVNEENPGIGGERLPFQKKAAPHSYIPRGSGPGNPDLPSWVAFDKQVLSFDAFFQKDVVESRMEQYAVRKVKLYFYLEDDSIQIVEPRLSNSWLNQGTLVRRHRIPRPPPDEDKFYTVEDLNVGAELNLYSTVYKLVDCDDFTRNFLTKLGFRVACRLQTPADAYTDSRKAEQESKTPYRPYDKIDTRGQFLDHDRHVLRFYCYWDDRNEMFGDKHWLILLYYLSDDTIEFIERLPPNSGRDVVPSFIHRGRLPKVVEAVRQPGQESPQCLLNVLGAPTRQVHGQRFILDPLKIGEIKTEFYKDRDLVIGAVINAWGRKVILYDCDCFTKEYYKIKYGIRGARMPPRHADPDADEPCDHETHKRVIPPYNGFGSEEDSLGYCLSMEPKAPEREFIKFMAYDRRGYDSNILRFLAKFDTNDPLQCDRRFILSYFRTDDTISIFEPPVRNSGRIPGMFLERGRIKKPGQERYPVEPSEYYTGEDLYVGAKLEMNSFKFILIDADDYVFKYMEKHQDVFDQSNICSILARLRAHIQCREDEVRAHFCGAHDAGPVPYDYFEKAVCWMSDGKITEHDVITLGRHYAADSESDDLVHWILVQIQARLRRFGFEEFTSLRDQAVHHDYTRSGKLNKKAVRAAFKAMRVPLTNDMLDALLDRTVKSKSNSTSTDQPHSGHCCQNTSSPCEPQCGTPCCCATQSTENLIDYSSLIDSIDWFCNPLDYGGAVPEIFDPDWKGQQNEAKVGCVRGEKEVKFRKFMEDLIGCPPAPPDPVPIECCKM